MAAFAGICFGQHFNFIGSFNKCAHAFGIVLHHFLTHVILKAAIAVRLASKAGNRNRSFKTCKTIAIFCQLVFNQAFKSTPCVCHIFCRQVTHSCAFG